MNFGPDDNTRVEVQNVVKLIQQYWDKVEFQTSAKEQDEFHEADFLRLDSTWAANDLEWTSVWGLNKTIKKPVDWYDKNITSKRICTVEDLAEYVNDAKQQHLAWC